MCECGKHGNQNEFKTKEELLKYKEYLERELSVVNKTLSDLEED